MGKTYRYQPPSKPAKLLVAENFEPRSSHYGNPQTVVVSANRGSNWELVQGSEVERPLSALTTNAPKLRSKVEHDRQAHCAGYVMPGQLGGAKLTRADGSRQQGKRQGRPSSVPKDHAPKPASRGARRAVEQRELNLQQIEELSKMEADVVLVQRLHGDKNTPTHNHKKANSAERRRTLHKEAHYSTMDFAVGMHNATAIY